MAFHAAIKGVVPQRIDCLVHNVSPSDIVLAVAPAQLHGQSAPLFESFVKPTFQGYAEITEGLINQVFTDGNALSLVHMDTGVGGGASGSSDGSGGDHRHGSGAYSSSSSGAPGSIPVGLRMQQPLLVDINSLVLREPQARQDLLCDEDKRPRMPTPYYVYRVPISIIYFPLVAALLQRWRGKGEGAGSSGGSGGAGAGGSSSGGGSSSTTTTKRILYLMAGASVPEDPDHPSAGSTTEHAALLLSRFIKMSFPDIAVQVVSSSQDVYRYDSTVNFLKSSLLPLIDAQRRTLVAAFAEGWKKRFNVSISMAAGAPARLAALNAALRPYLPSYLHVPTIKNFWYTGDIGTTVGTIALLDFDSIEASPPVALQDLDEDVSGSV